MAANPTPKQPPKPPQGEAGTLEQYRYMQQLYQNQYMVLSEEMTNRIDVLRDIDRARTTLENIDNIRDKNSLVSLGAGLYTNGKITNAKTALVSVGAGYWVEENIDKAKEHLTAALNRETEYVNKLTKNKKELENALIELSYKIDELSRQV